MSEEERRLQNLDVFYLFSHYVGTDLVASGMTENDYDILFDQKIDIERRWNILFPHLENVRDTSYTQTILECVKNFDDIISVCCQEDIFKFEKKYNTSIYNLKDYINMIDKIFEDSVKKRYMLLKVVLAYSMSINFEEFTFAEADRVFAKLFKLVDFGFFDKIEGERSK